MVSWPMARRGAIARPRRAKAGDDPSDTGGSTTRSLTFGRYVVDSLLGEGSMGRVYRAFDPLANRRVAIKTPRTEFAQGPEALDYIARFRREAQAAAALSHPHIVTVFDVGKDYFVMELLEGVTLQTLLAERGSLELAGTLRILEAIAAAVDFAHGNGVIHRDIKPANIFLQGDGRPKIMDFGIARLVSAAMTGTGQFVGSPAYMAPEQITGGPASIRTDLFSLAVVAYQMLTGRRPFEGENLGEVVYRVAHVDPAPPCAGTPGLPPVYDEVFRRALAKDAASRYATAAAFVAALDRRATPRTPEASTNDIETHDLKADPPARLNPLPSPASGAGSRMRPRRRPSLLLAGAAIAAMAGLWVLRQAGAFPFRETMAGLSVMTEPPNATVRLDGIRVGKTPLSQGSLAPGPHTVQVALDGFTPAELSLQLQADPLPTPLRFVLQPTTAVLEVRSDPAGAPVRIDGKLVGATPLEELSIPPGTHELGIVQPGLRPWTQTVHLNPGDRIPLNAILETASRPGPAQLTKLGWVRTGDLTALGPGVTPPVKISGEAAPYPSSAKRLKIEGTVTVAATVTETGEPVDVQVVRSAGALLDASLLATVKTWRYRPATKNDVKVRVRMQIEQRFPAKK
jgi:TonB family protein